MHIRNWFNNGYFDAVLSLSLSQILFVCFEKIVYAKHVDCNSKYMNYGSMKYGVVLPFCMLGYYEIGAKWLVIRIFDEDVENWTCFSYVQFQFQWILIE